MMVELLKMVAPGDGRWGLRIIGPESMKWPGFDVPIRGFVFEHPNWWTCKVFEIRPAPTTSWFMCSLRGVPVSDAGSRSCARVDIVANCIVMGPRALIKYGPCEFMLFVDGVSTKAPDTFLQSLFGCMDVVKPPEIGRRVDGIMRSAGITEESNG